MNQSKCLTHHESGETLRAEISEFKDF